MNAGGTMLRVYDSLRQRVIGGEFLPGERLDPTRLAEDEHASITPVRDALHRMTGERLIKSWQHEGFRQPVFTEALLRDLYRWNAAILDLALKHRGGNPPPVELEPPEAAYADRVASVWSHVARMADNREIWHAIDSLNARLHVARGAEQRVFGDCDAELAEVVVALADPARLRRSIARLHRRRERAVPAIAAALRPPLTHRSG